MSCDRGVWGRMHTGTCMDEFLRCSPEIITTLLISYECYASFFTLHLERKKVKLLSRVRLFVTPWTVAHQAPPSTQFSRQAYWSGLPFQYKIKKHFLNPSMSFLAYFFSLLSNVSLYHTMKYIIHIYI